MLTLDFINVGYGDAVLIRETGGTRPFTMLVDAGDEDTGAVDASSPRVTAAEFLRRENVTHIDLAVLSHLHRDHIGGFLNVLRAADCACVWTNYLPDLPVSAADVPDETPDGKLPRGIVASARQYLSALAALSDMGAEVVEKTAPEREIHLTNDLSVQLSVCDYYLHRRYRRTLDAFVSGRVDRYDLTLMRTYINLTSLRLTLSYKGARIVLPADAYAVYWEDEDLLPCRVLKAPHHGCSFGVSETLLTKLSPDVAVVCVSSDREDDRPSEEAVRLLHKYAKTVLYTDAVSAFGETPVSHASVHIELDG